MRKVWDLQRSMWDHRNRFVHKGQKLLHVIELEAVNDAMQYEYTIGRNGLAISYLSLFQGSINQLLQKSDASKLQRLDSIWKGHQQRKLGLDPWHKDIVATTFLHCSVQQWFTRRI